MYRTPTHTDSQITWQIILQPDFTQSHDYKGFDEMSAASLWHTGQLTWRKLLKSNYNADFIRQNIYQPTEVDPVNRNLTPVTTNSDYTLH